MNGSEESVRCNSPRLPAEGEEIKLFHDFDAQERTSKRPSSPNITKVCMASPSKCRAATPIRRCPSEERFQNDDYVHQDIDHPMDNGSGPSPPLCYRWAEDLLCLLHDVNGRTLYAQFLIQDGMEKENRLLNFWLACTNLKTIECAATLENTISALYRTIVKRSKEIRQETKDEIKRKIVSRTFSDLSIFDSVQKEIEAHFRKTTYPNFLESDLYIQYLQSYNDRTDRAEKEYEPNSSEPNKALPTVHEDSELQITISSKLRLSKEPWLRNRISETSRSRPEAPLGRFLRSSAGNYGLYHSRYASFLPASAQDSELQSLSSDAQTDDTMSQTGSSVDGGSSRYSRSHQRKHQRAVKYNASLNKDSLALNNFIPRTDRPPPDHPTKEEFHSLLVKKLNSYLDRVKLQEKINDKLRSIEGSENASQTTETVRDWVQKPAFEPSIFSMLGCVEENDQDILDRHISRVWQDSSQQTPVLSPGCASPSIKNSNEVQEFSRTAAEALPDVPSSTTCGFGGGANRQGVSFAGLPQVESIRNRRDQDTRSLDSGTVLDTASEAAQASSQKGANSFVAMNQLGCVPIDHQRRHREQSKRFTRNLTPTDNNISVDSGVNLMCNSHEKVTTWLEMKKFGASTSPVLSRSSSSKRPVVHSNCRPVGGMEVFSPSRSVVLPQSYDPSMPVVPPPDTTLQLVEARRRLEDERSKTTAKLKKQNRKSAPTGQESVSSSSWNEITTVGYCYGNHTVPYLSKFPGRNITLKQFKSHLSKKGNYRYFFKKASDDFGTGVVMEEISDDNDVLPLWEGKVFSVIEPAE